MLCDLVTNTQSYTVSSLIYITGADPGFQVRGRPHFKKLRRAEGGAKMFGVFRVKKRDFTPKNMRPPLDPPLYYITLVNKKNNSEE